jgi:hypothetical protein
VSKNFYQKFFEDELVFQKVFQEKTTLVVQMLLLAGCIGVYFFITGAVLSYTLNYLAPSYNSFTQFSVLVKYLDILLEVFTISTLSYVVLYLSRKFITAESLTKHFSTGGLLFPFAMFLFTTELQKKIKSLV